MTGIFYYELDHSLDNFKIKKHESYEEAVKYVYEHAKLYLIASSGNGQIEKIKPQLEQLEKLIAENKPENYNYKLGYCCDFSEFHHKIMTIDEI